MRVAGISSALVLLVLISLSIYPIVKNLNTVEAAEAKNSTTSLSITSTNSASVELLVKDSSGTFASSTTSQKLNFGVTTDNYAGYKLTLLGKDDSYANLKNSSTNTNLTSISTSSTVTSSSFNNGNWGYTLDGTNYRSAPNNTTGYTIDTTSAPNASTAKTYTLGVGAKADYSTKAGTYTNTYVLTAVGNGTPYVIYYKDNTNDSSVANLPSTQDESTTAINVNLSSTVPTRTGYTFSKWCDGTVSNDGTSCSGTLYSASASFGIDRTKPVANNTTTLYAVWTPKTYTLNITNNNTTSNPASSTTINFKGSTNITVTPNSGYYLSEVSCPSGYTCTGYSTGSDKTSAQTVTVTNNSTNAGGTLTFTATPSMTNVGELQGLSDSLCTSTAAYATDNRDNQDYVIQRLADGNCWMMTNLNLGATTLSTDLTFLNTNLSETVTAATFNGWKKTSGSQTYDAGEFIPVSGNDTYNNLPYGTLYNYYAASAGTIKSSSNSSNATYDICPAGWRLPTGGSSGEFNTLYTNSSYNTYAKARASVANGGLAFALAGYFSSGSPTGQGSHSDYWSSTRSDNYSTYTHVLTINTPNNVFPGNLKARNSGSSVRCIKKSPLEEFGVGTMQDIGNLATANKTALLAAMSVGTPYTVSDNRDSQSYTIAKLADGNLWMIDNLNLGATTLSTNLTSANTNLSSTITASTFNGWKKTQGSATYTAGEFIPITTSNSGNGLDADPTSGTKYGTLYNYYAASAGTISGNSSSANATYDICPKGWRLPTGDSNGEFKTLYSNSSYNSAAKMRASIANGGAAFALAGYLGTSTPSSQGGFGYYWSSMWSDSSRMYILSLDMTTVNPTSGSPRGNGRSIRCILDKATIADATYMQDVTAKMVANTADGATATLTDKRDGNTYKVTKINGNLWMTQNLRYKGDTVGSSSTNTTWYLKSATTNVTADKTMTMSDLTSGSTYDTARFHDSGSTSTGVWYNYAAASATTITGSSSSAAASQDICPKGWRLPTSSEQSGITSYKDAFSPVTGGLYVDGNVGSTGNGCWWSATAYNTNRRYYLHYNGSSLNINYILRDYGYYVRCIWSGA